MTEKVRPAAELEEEAREINAQPWKPPPGMVKKHCVSCGYEFASRGSGICPDCRAGKPGRKHKLTDSPFDGGWIGGSIAGRPRRQRTSN